MLKVKRLDSNAKLPTVAHPGEDLAYDIYALEETVLLPHVVNKIRTGIAAQAFDVYGNKLGLLVRDRSSMAGEGITVSGGVIDHGYTGEIKLLFAYNGGAVHIIRAGDKVAQMIPIRNYTGPVQEVEELDSSSRGDKGFGSTGK